MLINELMDIIWNKDIGQHDLLQIVVIKDEMVCQSSYSNSVWKQEKVANCN